MDLIDVTLACEDANSKCVDVVTVANEVWSYVHMFRLWSFGKIFKLEFGQYFAADVL